jgi:hypothetical protein
MILRNQHFKSKPCFLYFYNNNNISTRESFKSGDIIRINSALASRGLIAYMLTPLVFGQPQEETSVGGHVGGMLVGVLVRVILTNIYLTCLALSSFTVQTAILSASYSSTRYSKMAGTLQACCVTGFKHEGETEGELKSIGQCKSLPLCKMHINVSCVTYWFMVDPAYFAYPKTANPKKAIILITDVFGIVSNSQLLADDFARNGYLAVIPEILNNDAINFGDWGTSKVNLQTWLAKHGPETVEPVVEATIKHLREELGVEKIGTVGYCFGGRVS